MDRLDTWTVVNTTCTTHALAQWASVTAVSNGYLGLSGRPAEQRDDHDPVTLVSGVFDQADVFGQLRLSAEPRPMLDPGYFDSAGPSPTIANLPDPLFQQTFIDEREVALPRSGPVSFMQALDLRRGVMRYAFDVRDGWGRTTRFEVERFASLVHAHRVFTRFKLTPLDHDNTPVRIHAGVSGRVRANATRERQFECTNLWCDPPERCRLVARTLAREIEVRVGVVNQLRCGPVSDVPVGVAEHDAIYTRLAFRTRRGEPILLDRCAVVVTSEDGRLGVGAELEGELSAAVESGYDAALREHEAAWAALWERADVLIEGDDPAQLGLRFGIHHLLAAAPRFCDRLSVPTRLLTGEAYQGAVFYDTDLWIVPFYALTLPEAARSCVRFRLEGLRHAREIARSQGYAGAKLACQAGPTGEECLGRWSRATYANIHVNAAAVLALERYVAATGEQRFLEETGLELLVESARFYAARVTTADLAARSVDDVRSGGARPVGDRCHSAAPGGCDVLDTCGPDEGHGPVRSNFYTRVMAHHVLTSAAGALERLEREWPEGYRAWRQRGLIHRDDAARWRSIAAHLAPHSTAAEPFEQFAGFFRLPPASPELFDRRDRWYRPVSGVQACHQPDVLAALAQFPGRWSREQVAANYDYYVPRCLCYSSLSHPVHALLAAELGRLDAAYHHFITTIGMDLDESLTGRRDTHAGLHGTAAAGAWHVAVRGFGGARLSDTGLSVTPRLPARWARLEFSWLLRGAAVRFRITPEAVRVDVDGPRKWVMPARIGGHSLEMHGGQSLEISAQDT